MRVDQNAAQTLDPETLNETHAAHVCCEIVDLDRAFDGADGVLLLAQIHGKAFHARDTLVPLGQRLAVDGPDARVAEIVEIASQRTGDEPAGAGDDDQVIGPKPTVNGGIDSDVHSYRLSKRTQ